MDAIEHLPGCDLNHKPRKRCSSWAPAQAEVADPGHTREPDLLETSHQNKSHWGCFFATMAATAIVWIPVGLIGLAVTVFAGAWTLDRISLIDLYPPSLPKWARPPGTETDAHMGCGGNNEEFFPSCRTVVFGSTTSFPEIEASLRQEFESRGWTIRDEDRESRMSAISPESDHCISYSVFKREQAEENAQRYLPDRGAKLLTSGFWKVYSSRIDVYVSDCSGTG